MRSFVRDNSLTLAMALLFVVSLAGQVATGLAETNNDRAVNRTGFHGDSADWVSGGLDGRR